MGVRLECEDCPAQSVSSLFYRGPSNHRCHHCGGALTLADPRHDRRAGTDRRDRIVSGGAAWADWRSGDERRGAPL